MTDRILKLLTWPASLFVAFILLWYEQFKLTGSEGSVWLFTVLSDWIGIYSLAGSRRDDELGAGATSPPGWLRSAPFA